MPLFRCLKCQFPELSVRISETVCADGVLNASITRPRLVSGEESKAPGADGSGLLAIQRRSRKARSLKAWLPNSAVPMIVSTTASSITNAIEPRAGSATPIGLRPV